MHSQRLRQQKLKQQQQQPRRRNTDVPPAVAGTASPPTSGTTSPAPSSPSSSSSFSSVSSSSSSSHSAGLGRSGSMMAAPAPRSSGGSAIVSPLLTRTTSASENNRHSLPVSMNALPTVEHLLVAPQRRSTAAPLLRAPSAELPRPGSGMVPSPLSSPTLSHSEEFPRSRSGSFTSTPLLDDNLRGKGSRPSLNDELLQSLAKNDGRLALALLRTLKFEDMDAITQAIVEFHLAAEQDQTHPVLVHILNTVLAEEVKAHEEDPATLFRGKTNASKMLSLCLRKGCAAYLKQAIGPTITRVCENTPGVEIDPTRVSPEVAEANAANLYSLCESFLLSILSTVDSCPVFIRRLFAHLQRAASERYPDNKQITVHYSVIGGFIFLRFICSAIFTPVAYGAVDTPPKPEATRALALVSKVLQMLANGISFSHKESYMMNMNPFLDRYREDLVSFLRKLTTDPTVEPSESPRPEDASPRLPPMPGAEALLTALHKYAADLASALHAQDPSGASMKALAEFLVTFPPAAATTVSRSNSVGTRDAAPPDAKSSRGSFLVRSTSTKS